MVKTQTGENDDKITQNHCSKVRFIILIIIVIMSSIAISLFVLFVGFQLLFGLYTPFFKIASDSMSPTLQVDDTIIVSSLVPFSQLEKGDIIVFYSPYNNTRKIVHRIIDHFEVPSTEKNSKTNQTIIRTLGDANTYSIIGIDYPIREHSYIGKVVYHISNKNPFFNMLKPPLFHIIILIPVAAIASIILYRIFINKLYKKNKERG